MLFDEWRSLNHIHQNQPNGLFQEIFSTETGISEGKVMDTFEVVGEEKGDSHYRYLVTYPVLVLCISTFTSDTGFHKGKSLPIALSNMPLMEVRCWTIRCGEKQEENKKTKTANVGRNMCSNQRCHFLKR